MEEKRRLGGGRVMDLKGVKKVIDLGPFKHTVDEGLELRKAAFECMDFLLENAADQIQFPDFIAHLQLGLVVCFPSCVMNWIWAVYLMMQTLLQREQSLL